MADKCSLLSISLDFRAVYLLPSFLKLSCSFGIVVIRVHLSDSYLANIEAIPGFCSFEALVPLIVTTVLHHHLPDLVYQQLLKGCLNGSAKFVSFCDLILQLSW